MTSKPPPSQEKQIDLQRAQQLEQLMLRASFGEDADIHEFFLQLLQLELIAIDRHQETRMTHEPEYPSPFFGLLGIRDQERTVIPVFTRRELITEWCGQELQNSVVPFTKLLERIPQRWWIVLNPGQDIEKEISPWEVDLLGAGKEGIEEIVKEHLASEYATPLGIEPIPDGESSGLRSAIITWAAAQPSAKSLRLAREISRDSEGRELKRLLLGIEVDTDEIGELAVLRAEAQAEADLAQIGSEEVRVLVGKFGMQSLALSALASIPPFWESAKTNL